MNPIKKLFEKYEQEAYQAYESVSGKKLRKKEDGTYEKQGRNDAVDAFRHAYASAAVAQDYSRWASHIAGDTIELAGDLSGQDVEERNMDDWNNAVGREIGSSTDTREEIKEAVWEALNNGDLIIDPYKDQRKYQSYFERRNSKINELWNQAKQWVLQRIDLLALDLDGDGIETRGTDGKIVFDHNNDGVKTGTGWVRSDDGLLVLDRNSNGTIDNGGELFGVDTVKADGTKASDGFDALSDLDSNNDDIFNSSDTRFADVRVWRDLNQDGISQSNELSTLAANNIRSISLSKTSTTTHLGNGNTQTATATFTRTDDTTGTAANLGLASNTFYRKFTNPVTLTDAAKKLPGACGSSNVCDRSFENIKKINPALWAKPSSPMLQLIENQLKYHAYRELC